MGMNAVLCVFGKQHRSLSRFIHNIYLQFSVLRLLVSMAKQNANLLYTDVSLSCVSNGCKVFLANSS